ncbi:MAG: LON peptidase substrate-binding domain-containing protein [Blastocatellia bacterium]|nr:LON peptidase substrate-binding domain-containing protein [Blastocatellia bacterium]
MSIQQIPHLEGIRRLKLFPLPVVLFPGAMLPLHIFEERYKQMIRDAMESDKVFGVTYTDQADNWPPPVGRVGCAAFILATVPLTEGRMNLLTTGLRRYRALSYSEEQPYLEGEVEFFQDEPVQEDLDSLIQEVKETFRRVVRATRIINQNEGDAEDDLSDEPEDLSFAIASSLQLEDRQKLELVELSNSKTRLQRLETILSSVVKKYEIRAMIHEKAKTNGHGPRKIVVEHED